MHPDTSALRSSSEQLRDYLYDGCYSRVQREAKCQLETKKIWNDDDDDGGRWYSPALAWIRTSQESAVWQDVSQLSGKVWAGATQKV